MASHAVESHERFSFDEMAATVFNFAKTQAPHFASIKFRGFEKKLESECIKFRDFLYSWIYSFDFRTVTT